MLLCLLFAPALHTRMKRRRSVPESINRRFSFRLLNTVTRPTHLGESAKKAKTFIGRVSLLPSREKRKKERKRKDSRPNTNLLSFSNWFSVFLERKEAEELLFVPYNKQVVRLSSSPSVTPPALSTATSTRIIRDSTNRRTRSEEPPSVFLSRCNKLLPPVAAYHRASSILIKSALRKPSFPEGSQFC